MLGTAETNNSIRIISEPHEIDAALCSESVPDVLLSEQVTNALNKWLSLPDTRKLIDLADTNEKMEMVVESVYTDCAFFTLRHIETSETVRKWLWSRCKSLRCPLQIGSKVLWPVRVKVIDGKPAGGASVPLSHIKMQKPFDGNPELRFKAAICRRYPNPVLKGDRVVVSIDEEGIVCICRKPFNHMVMYFTVTGYTKKRTAVFVEPVMADLGNKVGVFVYYDMCSVNTCKDNTNV